MAKVTHSRLTRLYVKQRDFNMPHGRVNTITKYIESKPPKYYAFSTINYLSKKTENNF